MVKMEQIITVLHYINNDNITTLRDVGKIACKRCKSKCHMNVVKKDTVIDSCRYICSNKILNAGKTKYEICSTTCSVRRQSWFSGSHLFMSEIFLFTYYWWNNYTLECIERELKWAHQTVVDWANFAREVAIEAMLRILNE